MQVSSIVRRHDDCVIDDDALAIGADDFVPPTDVSFSGATSSFSSMTRSFLPPTQSFLLAMKSFVATTMVVLRDDEVVMRHYETVMTDDDVVARGNDFIEDENDRVVGGNDVVEGGNERVVGRNDFIEDENDCVAGEDDCVVGGNDCVGAICVNISPRTGQEWPDEHVYNRSPKTLGPPRGPPATYPGALEWLDALGGAFITTLCEEGTVLVSVGALGRSAQAIAPSAEPAEIERALVEAAALLHRKL
jgi:hypothetical protein